jgi:hypothetical protein
VAWHKALRSKSSSFQFSDDPVATQRPDFTVALIASKKGEKADRIERSSGNVFADLGFNNPAELLAKAELVQRIADIIAERKLIFLGKTCRLR